MSGGGGGGALVWLAQQVGGESKLTNVGIVAKGLTAPFVWWGGGLHTRLHKVDDVYVACTYIVSLL